MNKEKARDFFSAYFEGHLDPALRQSLERQLQTDAVLQADYSAFVETIQELDTLKHEDIEIPSFLSDRIATRLEQVQTKKRFGLPVWTTWMRGVAFAGLAIAAITFALPIFGGDKTVSTGGTTVNGTVDQIEFKADGSKLILSYAPSGAKTVIVSSPSSGKEVQRFNLNGQRLESPIENTLSAPAVFKVQVLPGTASSIIVVPGTVTGRAKSGEGTVQDLALAIAGRYHVPVVIDAADITHHVTWNFSAPDALTAASQALGNDGFSVDQRSGGLIKILDR